MFRSTSGVRQPAIWLGKRFPKLGRVDSKTLSVAFSHADLCDKCLTSSPHDFDLLVAIPEHVVHRMMPKFFSGQRPVVGLALRCGCDLLIQTVFLQRLAIKVQLSGDS